MEREAGHVRHRGPGGGDHSRRATAGPGTDLPTPGSTSGAITPDNVARLPIDANDLTALVALVPGITTLAGTDSTAAAFSVAGQRADANAVTLDGLLFGSGSVPQDAVRATRVVTSTYYVARGQFSGGLVASTTRSGTNVIQGSGNYSLRDNGLTGGRWRFPVHHRLYPEHDERRPGRSDHQQPAVRVRLGFRPRCAPTPSRRCSTPPRPTWSGWAWHWTR